MMRKRYSPMSPSEDSTDRHNSTIRLSPSVLQYLADELIIIILFITSCLAIIYFRKEDIETPIKIFAWFLAIFLGLYLMYKEAWYHALRYTITEEQLFVDFGVFSKSRCYMELYRVVDFYEHKSFLQRLAGIRIITVYSTDRTTPSLNIIGIRGHEALVDEIRTRVEINRQKKNIYEFSNQR